MIALIVSPRIVAIRATMAKVIGEVWHFPAPGYRAPLMRSRYMAQDSIDTTSIRVLEKARLSLAYPSPTISTQAVVPMDFLLVSSVVSLDWSKNPSAISPSSSMTSSILSAASHTMSQMLLASPEFFRLRLHPRTDRRHERLPRFTWRRPFALHGYSVPNDLIGNIKTLRVRRFHWNPPEGPIGCGDFSSECCANSWFAGRAKVE